MINKDQSKNVFKQFYGFFPYNSVCFDGSHLLRCRRKTLTQPCSFKKAMVDVSSSLKRSISSKELMKLRLARADAVTP